MGIIETISLVLGMMVVLVCGAIGVGILLGIIFRVITMVAGDI